MTVSRALLPFLSLAMAAACFAQAPPSVALLLSERVIESRLQSGDPRLVAWGAHDTLASHDEALIPMLLSLAAEWRRLPADAAAHDGPPTPTQDDQQVQQDQQGQRDAMAAVLDALIQMNASVPVDTLRLLAPDFGNAVAVLLSRMPPEDSGALAFEFYRAKPVRQYGLQYVSASLLALHPVPGFAADLVANTPVEANIFVITPGGQQLGGGVSTCCGIGSVSPHKDWPLTGQYLLGNQNIKGSLLFVGGVDPVYAQRELSAVYLGNKCYAQSSATLTPDARLRLIAEMLGIAPDTLG